MPLPTALYAMNIAVVSLTQTIMYQVGRAPRAKVPPRPDRQNRLEVLGAMITPVVFLALGAGGAVHRCGHREAHLG